MSADPAVSCENTGVTTAIGVASQKPTPLGGNQLLCPLCKQPYVDVGSTVDCAMCNDTICNPCAQVTLCYDFQTHCPREVLPKCSECFYQGFRATQREDGDHSIMLAKLFHDMDDAEINNYLWARVLGDEPISNCIRCGVLLCTRCKNNHSCPRSIEIILDRDKPPAIHRREHEFIEQHINASFQPGWKNPHTSFSCVQISSLGWKRSECRQAAIARLVCKAIQILHFVNDKFLAYLPVAGWQNHPWIDLWHVEPPDQSVICYLLQAFIYNNQHFDDELLRDLGDCFLDVVRFSPWPTVAALLPISTVPFLREFIRQTSLLFWEISGDACFTAFTRGKKWEPTYQASLPVGVFSPYVNAFMKHRLHLPPDGAVAEHAQRLHRFDRFIIPDFNPRDGKDLHNMVETEMFEALYHRTLLYRQRPFPVTQIPYSFLETKEENLTELDELKCCLRSEIPFVKEQLEYYHVTRARDKMTLYASRPRRNVHNITPLKAPPPKVKVKAVPQTQPCGGKRPPQQPAFKPPPPPLVDQPKPPPPVCGKKPPPPLPNNTFKKPPPQLPPDFFD